MLFVTALAFAASASTLVTARLEQQVRRHDSHLAARAPRPEPFRLFSAPGATVDQTGPRLFAAASPVQHEERIALRERAEVSIAELDALLTSVHPFAAVAEPAQLSKRSDTPKKGLKCHRRKKANPSSASTSSSIQSTELAASVQQPAAQPSQDKSGERKSYAQQQADAQKGHEEAKASSAPSSNSGNSGHDASASASFATQKESTQKESDNSQSTEANKVWDGAKGKGLIGYSSSNCGPSGATDEFPNGSESFLSCGISKSDPSSGWRIPDGITLDHLKTVSLEHALATNNVWEPCKPFIPLFEKYGAQTGLPPILLAAIALQESTCNPHVSGDSGGAFGLMQITQDKCSGRDGHGCAEPDYNVRTGAEYLKKEIDNAGGSFIKALGAYNGWQAGLTYGGATAAAYGSCCVCQQNLDYIHQMLNGWLLGRTGYELGTFRNLDVCH